MDGWLADLIAFLWWQHDAERAEAEPEPVAVASTPRNQKVPRAWDAVVGEWEHD